MYVEFGFSDDQECTLYLFNLVLQEKAFHSLREKFLLTVTLDVVDIFQLLNLIVLDGG